MKLNKKQEELLNTININGRWSEYKDVNYNINLWKNFWTNIYKGEKNDSVLDFGCGSTWGGYVAKRLNYVNHTNVDIDIPEVRNIFGAYAKALNQNVLYYDGISLPFEDSCFSSIVAKASIMKLDKTNLNNVVDELLRVSNNGATWYIASKGMCFRFKEAIENERLVGKIESKKISIKCWTWYPFEFNRSKTPLTEFYFLYKLHQVFRKIKSKFK
jgi:SAM-dependent methyltransferase